MKVRVKATEFWPAYEFVGEDDLADATLDVPEETVERWKRLMAEWEAMQSELDELVYPLESRG